MRRDTDFLVIISRVLGWLDNRETKLAGEAGPAQVPTGHGVRVIPAGACRFRRKAIAPMTMGGNCRRPFFNGSVYGRWDVLAVPVDRLGDVRFVEDVECNRLPFLEPEDRPRHRPV